jgi:hypothetical protein
MYPIDLSKQANKQKAEVLHLGFLIVTAHTGETGANAAISYLLRLLDYGFCSSGCQSSRIAPSTGQAERQAPQSMQVLSSMIGYL